MTSDQMTLTDEEKGWAMAIKKAMMEEDTALAAQVTDMEYAQHAIVAKEKVPKALKRIKRLHAFKEAHGIQDKYSLDGAMESIQKFEALSPGVISSFGQSENGRYVFVMLYREFIANNYRNKEDWDNCFAAFFYLFEAMQPDIYSIREGLAMIADCEGMGWKNFSLEMEKNATALYQDSYPARIKELTMLNAPGILRAMYVLIAPFLNKKVKEVFHMTGKVEDVQSRFPKDALPTTLGGTQGSIDMEQKLREALKTRIGNQGKFSLE
jgi:hypothetical protein